MASDAQKNYKRALKRVEDALDAFNKEKGHFNAKRIHGNELTPAVERLLAAKLALLRESKDEPEPKKTIQPHDRYFK
jgi:hypothetical protein